MPPASPVRSPPPQAHVANQQVPLVAPGTRCRACLGVFPIVHDERRCACLRIGELQQILAEPLPPPQHATHAAAHAAHAAHAVHAAHAPGCQQPELDDAKIAGGDDASIASAPMDCEPVGDNDDEQSASGASASTSTSAGATSAAAADGDGAPEQLGFWPAPPATERTVVRGLIVDVRKPKSAPPPDVGATPKQRTPKPTSTPTPPIPIPTPTPAELESME